MSVIVKGMEMPESCFKCKLKLESRCPYLIESTSGVFDKKLKNCPLKSIEGLIAEIEHITPKATVRYGKLSIDSCLMIPVDKVIETIKEYCEVIGNANSN